ncbi:MAG: hypothetical protein HLX50_11785 [Alteromonadaceae bacterium]|nr:hypothetical protein [Alteromonadaceae bacterium]
MEPVAIHLKETCGLARAGEPISMGVPFAQNQLTDTTDLQLLADDTGKHLSADFTPLCYWPDGSIRWLQVEAQITLTAGQSRVYALTRAVDAAYLRARPASLDTRAEGLLIGGESGLLLHAGALSWQHLDDQMQATTHARLVTGDGQPCYAVADSDWRVEKNGAVTTRSVLTGTWRTPAEKRLCRFRCTLTLYHASGLLDVAMQTHNPDRARHRGGLWDLGDEGSVYFQSLELITDLPGAQACLNPDVLASGQSFHQSSELLAYQDSSGGENWDSVNHQDKNGKLTTHFPGYQLRIGNEAPLTGKRSNPVLSLGTDSHLHIAMPGFWQNFPSSLGYSSHADQGQAVAGLFPRQPDNAVYELQGGERKTLRCLYQHGTTTPDIRWAYRPIVPTLAAEVYQRADAFPWFTANAPHNNTHNAQDKGLDSLIREGLDGDNNFFAKREAIDEYGWRNFGDLFADHESLYLPPEAPPFISHYNNQYDPIYGFARQFALSGDPRWFELMDDLARHVVDIDIYHTDQDRAEYNHGLFWHTDHYLPAHTATHRTFSRHNRTSSTPGQTGGGPAEEHCYTTGLLYHHLLTGNATSRQAVLDLATWVTALHEGSGSLIEQLLRIARRDLPRARALLTRGHRQSHHVYLFNRGTGNYLNTLLDAHLLEPDGNWLAQAETVIRGTIHPQDRISDRNLLNAESGWSYLVLLAAISRFLLIKEEAGCRDTSWHHARESLAHYTRWMLANEQPFLEKAEELEFANHTWAAQDIRKAMVLYQAMHHDPALAQQYRSKADEFYHYVLRTLALSPERTLTRVQVILLQNYGPHPASMQHRTSQPEIQALGDIGTAPDSTRRHTAKPDLTWAALLARITGRLAKGVRGFTLTKEQKWLSTRMER